MGNSSSNIDKLERAANENVSSSGASNAIKQFNGIQEMEPNKEKAELNFKISSAESSIIVTRENIAEYTKKLNIEQERLQKLEATLNDAKANLASFNSSSSGAGGGTRKKILNKNNRKKKTRTSCKK